MNEVLRQYAAAHDRFAEAEQMLVQVGDYAAAESAHQQALVVLRAYKAELDDPEPRETCACGICALLRMRKMA